MPAHLHLSIHGATVWATLWLCAVGAAIVFAVMIHSVATFRRGSAVRRRPVGDVLAEVLWAIVPIAIMAASATPAMRTAMSSPSAPTHYAQSETPLSITVAAGYNADRK